MPKLTLTKQEKEAIILDEIANWQKRFFREKIRAVLDREVNLKPENLNKQSLKDKMKLLKNQCE